MTRAVELAQVASLGVSEAFKNRIINGAMVIDQRNGGASVTPTSNVTYTLDRWVMLLNQSSKYSVQQNAGSVTPPAGFTNYMGFTSTSAYTVGVGEVFAFRQSIEGYNTADLGWGTANAKTVTVSFWIRSSLTGTFGGAIKNNAEDRAYPFSYTISAANTWEQKSITIAGDTSGTWLTTNGIGISIVYSLGVGSNLSGTAGAWTAGNLFSSTGATSVVGTNGATLYITGVQLEVGSSATSFEYRPYSTELQLCQRYLYRIGGGNQYIRIGTGPAGSSTNGNITVFMQTPMRIAPTSVTQTGSLGLWAGATVFAVTALTIETSSASPITVSLSPVVSSGLTTGTTYQLIGNNDGTAAIALSAEL